MKKIILILGAMLIGTASYADMDHSNSALKNLGSAWKAEQMLHAKESKNDITIVYGGADISRRPTLASHITTV